MLLVHSRAAFTALLLIGLAMLVLVFPNDARATVEPLEPVLGDDYSVEMARQPEGQSQSIRLFSEGGVDPLGIVVKAPFMRRHTLDTDHWQVFGCGSPAGQKEEGAFSRSVLPNQRDDSLRQLQTQIFKDT